MVCLAKVRLQQLYDALRRRWRQIDNATQISGDKTWPVQEVLRRALIERDAAKDRLELHQQRCEACSPRRRTSALDGLSGRRCESVTLGSERRRQSGRTEWVTLLLQGDKGTAYLLQQFWGIGIVSNRVPYLPLIFSGSVQLNFRGSGVFRSASRN